MLSGLPALPATVRFVPTAILAPPPLSLFLSFRRLIIRQILFFFSGRVPRRVKRSDEQQETRRWTRATASACCTIKKFNQEILLRRAV